MKCKKKINNVEMSCLKIVDTADSEKANCSKLGNKSETRSNTVYMNSHEMCSRVRLRTLGEGMRWARSYESNWIVTCSSFNSVRAERRERRTKVASGKGVYLKCVNDNSILE